MQKQRKTIVGLVFSALFLVLIFYNVDLREIIATFKRFELENVSAIVAMFAFTLLARAVRWGFLLKCDKRFSLYELSSTWVIGNLMNAFLPARAGDIWRSFAVGANAKESKMKIFGSVMLERILDGVSVCFLLYFCVMMYANLSWIRRCADISMLLFGGSLAFVYLVVRFEKVDAICSVLTNLASRLHSKIRSSGENFISRVCHQIKLFVSGFEVLKSTYFSLVSVVLSFGVWIVECLITYWVITSFGIKCPISAAMFVICFVALGSMIPSSSIFVGPYQYAYILALGIYFIPKSEALAIAVVHQSILMGSLLVFSAVFFLLNLVIDFVRSRRSAVEKQSPENSAQAV